MNLKAFLMLFSMMYNLYTFSENFFLISYHVTNIQKIFWYLRFFATLLCKEKESTKHLLVTSLIAQKSLRTHTKINSIYLHCL